MTKTCWAHDLPTRKVNWLRDLYLSCIPTKETHLEVPWVFFIIIIFDNKQLSPLVQCRFPITRVAPISNVRCYPCTTKALSQNKIHNKYIIALLYNLFVTSKNETTNSPILEFKVLHESLLKPLFISYLLLLKTFQACFFILKALKDIFKFVNWWILGFVFWRLEQVNIYN